MAKLTQEDVDKMRDTLREEYNYADMSDEQKKVFDDTFDEKIDQLREQGIVEPKKTDTDEDDNTDETVNADKGKEHEHEHEHGGGSSKEEEKESKSDEDAVKKKEYAQMDAQIAANQEKLNAEQQRKAEEAKKKERDSGDRDF